MPSITVPSPGISSPVSTTTTSPRVSSDAGLVPPSLQPRGGLLAHRAQRRGLGLAAAFGDRLGEVAEEDGEPQPDGHGEREPAGLPGLSDDPHHRGEQGADLDDEHDRVADHLARVELAHRRRAARSSRIAGSNSECSRLGVLAGRRRGDLLHVGHREVSRSRSRLSSSTLIAFSPAEPEQRPARVVARSARARGRGRCRAAWATRLAWMRALSSEMSGSTPEADVVAASDGMPAAVSPGV